MTRTAAGCIYNRACHEPGLGHSLYARCPCFSYLMDGPLIDLEIAPTGLPVAEPLSPPLEVQICTVPAPDAQPTPSVPDTLRGSSPQPPAGQSNLNDSATLRSTASPSRKLVPTPWFFARVRAVYIGHAEFVPGKISHRWLVASEVVFLIMAIGQVW
ncbi:hypothetical protein GY45DRAFT_457600 [Cubamyces sp. BRFM 1775]|nr:hypothetical protein GY45DRAFT_457600 [Cubamyces sp. BRFM 1775]